METRHPLILFADRELQWSLPLRKRLAERGFQIETVENARDLIDRVERGAPELVVLGDRLDDLGSRLLGGLIQERSPTTRIVRVLAPPGSGAAEEPGAADNLLCSVSRRATPEQWVAVVTRMMSCTPRRTLATRPPLVVCVDDDAAFLRSLGRVIRRQGYRVLTYTEPELAIEELPIVRPDLIVLDVLMPGLSGFEVLDELRQFHPSPVPVILLSALDTDAKLDEARRHGAASYLTKPCAPEQILESVRRVLAARAVGSGARVVGKAGPRGRAG